MFRSGNENFRRRKSRDTIGTSEVMAIRWRWRIQCNCGWFGLREYGQQTERFEKGETWWWPFDMMTESALRKEDGSLNDLRKMWMCHGGSLDGFDSDVEKGEKSTVMVKQSTMGSLRLFAGKFEDRSTLRQCMGDLERRWRVGLRFESHTSWIEIWEPCELNVIWCEKEQSTVS